MNASEYLNEIEKRAEAAADGPWETVPTVGNAVIAHDEDDYWSDVADRIETEEDAEFIAASRTDVPKMAKALRAVLGIQAFTAGPDAEPGGDEDSWSLGFAQGLETARRAITEALEGEE